MGAVFLGKYLYNNQNYKSIKKSEKEIRFLDQHNVYHHKSSRSRLPAELLILNRYGIGYPYLKAAWKLSQKYCIPPLEILIKTNVISLETWFDAQKQLHQERIQFYQKRQQEALLLKQSVSNLTNTLPHYSAKHTFTNWQIIIIVFSVICIGTSFYLNNQNAFFALYMLMALFYMASIFLRSLILASFKPAPSHSTELQTRNDKDLPIYSVLVALYQEANQIEALTNSLWKLDWPRQKLDIKLICEADDFETIKAITDAKLPSCFELIRVPKQEPRTKPKALNYALPLCKGEYVVLYDAEDHPSPGQLREAYMKFQSSDNKLACVQAPLHIHNQNQNWLSGMFAIEYVTLFNGILPVLARWRVPIPLGGTSNHFKTDILKKVGAWDPFNVTEDADLGIRLFREGYRSSTITLPTFEEAPPALWPWIKQRTRWLKGWMQTVLVHSRNPIYFISDMGIKNAFTFHLLMTSLIISALIHPFFLVATLGQVFNLTLLATSHYEVLLIATSIFNLVGGYTTYGLLAYVTLKHSKYHHCSKLLFSLPIYWLLISFAGWRAIVHLIVTPHKWEKTPHGLAK